MKALATLVLVTLALVPATIAAQTPSLTGNWNATFTRTAPTGETQSITFTFHFTQKGKVLSGTIGPEPARQWKVEKGVVDGTKITFQVQQPDGPLRSFILTHAKGRLQGHQKLEFNGQTAEVTVDASARSRRTRGRLCSGRCFWRLVSHWRRSCAPLTHRPKKKDGLSERHRARAGHRRSPPKPRVDHVVEQRPEAVADAHRERILVAALEFAQPQEDLGGRGIAAGE